jgi:hypothetical protein
MSKWDRDDENDESDEKPTTGDPPTIELDENDSGVTEVPLPRGKAFQSDRTRPAPTLPPPSFDGSISSTSGMLSARPSLFTLARAGARALRRFPGLCGSIYLAQLAVSVAAAGLIGMLLSDAFARRPIFDRGVDGDLAALAMSFMARPDLLTSLLLIGGGAILLYALVSLFLTGGLIAVLLDPPDRRREVARWFGAGGAANFFPLVRLALWSILPYAAVVVAVGVGAGPLPDALASALTPRDLLVPLLVAFGPALFLHWIIGTAVDYARVDLVRHPGMSSLRGLLRGFSVLVSRPLVLLHTFLYGLFFAAVTAGYIAISGSLADGLLVAILIRQLVSLLRFVAHVALVAGQVEIACSAMPAPTRRRFG